ncbi:MAG: DUF1127 domain-containing protein [Tabrizicola sp.]|jgi:uncharacterized protein YjiS (DUF1127 family)|uniref:DUF1127 domain-containing protein n=1 Tax=Tabrizicola sp. TaxID=2005166 RepID=UPI001B5EE9B7|nr:DUF1127 domain-containing protein [Tabrizicola sp.]MCC6518804.1 DUF1127 domain-containing protein [Tabrizicola sp.]
MSAHFLARPLALLRPGSLSRLPHRLLAASTLVRSRHSLRLLDDHLLRDIGVTRAEALSEADRAPWDAPGHWKG